MSKIQKTLDALQPYVIGIRYLEGVAIVDAVFKEGWTLPESNLIKKIKGGDDMNYQMIFSEAPNIGLDELLEYVEKVISVNQEREKKHDLLRQKVNELKEVFKTTSLNKLKNLRFTFTEDVEDDLTPNISELDLDLIEESSEIIAEEPKEIITPKNEPNEVFSYLDENGEKIELTEEDKEILEEEERAKKNRNMFKNQGRPKPRVDLPPKRKPAMELQGSNYESDCDCGPNEACGGCIEKKDL